MQRKWQGVLRYTHVAHISTARKHFQERVPRNYVGPPVASAALAKCLIPATPRKISQIAVLIWWKENPKTSKIRRSGDWAETSFAPLCRVFPPGRRQLRASEELFFSIIDQVFCQHGWRPHSADPANPFGVVCQQRMFCIQRLARSKRIPNGKEAAPIMPFCASCTQCETRSHVLDCTLSERDSRGPRCVVTSNK
jgi:hypothetical protein